MKRAIEPLKETGYGTRVEEGTLCFDCARIRDGLILWSPIGIRKARKLGGFDWEMYVCRERCMSVGGEGNAQINGAFEITKDVFAVVEVSCGWIR